MSRTTRLPSPALFTYCCWARCAVNNAASSGLMMLQDANSTGNYVDLVLTSANPPQPQIQLNGTPTPGNTSFGPTLPLNEWRFLAIVGIAHVYSCYYSRAGIVEMIVGASVSNASAEVAFDTFRVLGDAQGDPLNGNVACARLWDDALSPDELFAEKMSMYAVKSAKLLGDYPLLNAEDAAADYSSLKLPLTYGATRPRFEGTYPPISPA